MAIELTDIEKETIVTELVKLFEETTGAKVKSNTPKFVTNNFCYIDVWFGICGKSTIEFRIKKKSYDKISVKINGLTMRQINKY